jgi:hypothetical protein
MPLAQAPLSAFAGGGSEADEGFLDSQSGRFGGQVVQAIDCAGPRCAGAAEANCFGP